jgi:hypothetical protein
MLQGWEVDETGSASCPVDMCDAELLGFTFKVSFIYRAYDYHLNQVCIYSWHNDIYNVSKNILDVAVKDYHFVS